MEKAIDIIKKYDFTNSKIKEGTMYMITENCLIDIMEEYANLKINFAHSSTQLPSREESIIELENQIKIYSKLKYLPYKTETFVQGYRNAFVDYYNWLIRR